MAAKVAHDTSTGVSPRELIRRAEQSARDWVNLAGKGPSGPRAESAKYAATGYTPAGPRRKRRQQGNRRYR